MVDWDEETIYEGLMFLTLLLFFFLFLFFNYAAHEDANSTYYNWTVV